MVKVWSCSCSSASVCPTKCSGKLFRAPEISSGETGFSSVWHCGGVQSFPCLGMRFLREFRFLGGWLLQQSDSQRAPCPFRLHREMGRRSLKWRGRLLPSPRLEKGWFLTLQRWSYGSLEPWDPGCQMKTEGISESVPSPQQHWPTTTNSMISF